MKINNIKIVALLCVVGLVMVGLMYRTKQNGERRVEDLESDGNFWEVVVGEERLKVEVADEPAEMDKGLGARDELGSDGMLFVMPGRMRPMFWMKGMRFGLDFVWIDCGEGLKAAKLQSDKVECVVVGLHEDIRPPGEMGGKIVQVRPDGLVTHVLEVEAGWVEEWDVKIGDVVDLKMVGVDDE